MSQNEIAYHGERQTFLSVEAKVRRQYFSICREQTVITVLIATSSGLPVVVLAVGRLTRARALVMTISCV